MSAEIDFDDLAKQALSPPAQGGQVLQFPTPANAPGPDYEGLAGQIMGMQKAAATQNLVSAQSTNPDNAAKALQASKVTGIPQPAAEENLVQAEQAATLQKNVETLGQNPNLSAFVASNPLAARMAQDDFDKLGLIERLSTAFKSGASTALLTNQLGRFGNEQQLGAAVGVSTPTADAKIKSLQGSINAQPKLTGPLGFAQNFTGFLAGLVDNAIEGGTQGALVGAATGAGVGAFAGGVGAIPGAAAGAGTGAAVGFNIDMARVAAGNAYIKMGQMRGSDGQPLSEGGKQFGAVFTGAATYAIGKYASGIESKLLGETAESLAQAAIAKAAQSPTFASAVASFAGGAAKGAAQGAVLMTAMEASGVIGEEIAKVASQGHFDTDPHEIVDRLADAAINGAVLLGTMHGSMRGLSLYGDIKSAQRATSSAEMMQNIMTGATESKLRERDLQSFQDFMQHQTDGSPVENLYLPASVVRELYQGARFDPALGERAQDPLFSFVSDMQKQLEEAAASNGDVVIKTSDFVAHLAGSPIAERLMPDMRVGADAMSLNEANAFKKEYADRIKQATEEAAKGGEVSPTQRIADEVRQQAVAAGYSDAVASRYGAVYAARYGARGERLGIDPYEAFKQSRVSIEKGAVGDAAGRTLNQEAKPEAHIGSTLVEIGKDKSLYQYPKSAAKDMATIAKDKNPKLKVEAETITQMDGSEKPTGHYNVTLPGGRKGSIQEKDGKVWINAAGVGEGKGGSLLYDLAANYAHSNGLKFIGDPDGLSDAGMRRRLENMLSSAVKYGTTDHLEPHPRQLRGESELALPPLAWQDGDTAGNIRSMVRASVATHEHGNPLGTSLDYNPATGNFYDAAGNVIADAHGVFADLASAERGASGAGASGRASLQRNALFRALLSGEDARRSILDRVRGVEDGRGEGIGEPLKGSFYQGLEEGPRGQIRFTDGKAVISLFEKADPSTLIHESGHAWLEELAADATGEKAPQQLRDDMATVREWLGNDGGELTTPQHEQFARAAEAYFMEGKAPTLALARVFTRFKQWLTRIYQTVSRLDTPINDDIRQVFDRLLATDAEIEQAKQTTGLEPNFKTREDAGMTAAEWKAYTNGIERANQQAESALLDKTMARIRRQRSAEYREERAKAVDEAAKEVDARPDVDALNMLRGTKVPGNPENIKLSAKELEQVYGKDGVSSMPKGTVSKDGVHPDYVAEMLGFDSGDALVRSLQGLEKQQREIQATEGEKRGIRKYLIDQAADQKMEQRHPDVMDEGAIREEAISAIHSEQRAQLLAQELRYLKRSAARALEDRGAGRKAVEQVKTEEDWKAAEADLMAKLDKAKDQNKIDALKAQLAEVRQGIKDVRAEESESRAKLREAVNVSKPMLDAIRAHVDAILANKTTEDVGNFGQYLRDERKAAREVQQAILKKDWAAAAAAKQRQLLSHVVYTRAKEAAADIERGTATFKRLTSKAKFDGIAQEYTDQIHDLLGRFGFDSGRGEELQRGKPQTLEEFVNAKSEDAGIEIAIDPALYAMQGKPVGSLKLSEFRALDEAIDSLRELGRGEKMISVDGVERDFKEVKHEIVTAIRALGERMKSDYYDPRDAGKLAAAKEKLFGVFRNIDATLTKPEALFDQIDKADPFGIMNRAVFRRLKEAQGREDRWQEVASKDLKDAVESAGKDWSKRLNDVVPDDPALLNPDTGRPMKLTRKRMLSMALNWGNEGNRIKLADGYKWSAPAIKAFLDRNMSKADWDFVQRIWGMFDARKQELDDLQRRVTGVGLDMVHADAFNTPHGTYSGGYYPIVYDATKSFAAETHAEKATEALFPNGYTRATTPKGSTISRVEGVKRPIQLSLDIAPWKIGQVIHDVAFREAIIDADRLLSADSVKKAMDDVFGPEYRKMLRPWLKHIANSRNIDDAAIGWLDKAISTVRTNTVIVGIGFRLSTMFKHGFGALSNSIGEVGAKDFLAATRDLYSPRGDSSWSFIFEKSAEMKYRRNAYDKDIASQYDKLVNDSTYTTFQKNAQHFGHLGVSYLDLGSAGPVWLAAYRQSIAKGIGDADAVYIADKAVRNAHGAQGITDTAAFQRAKGVANLVNMFYGFFNHIYNRQRVIVSDAASGIKNVKAGEYREASKDFASVLARSFWYIAVPAIVETLAHHGGPNEDNEESWGAWAAKAMLGEIPAGIPVVRDIAKAALEGRDYEISPIAKAVNDVIGLKRDITNYVQGNDPSPHVGKHMAIAAGYALGLPLAAPFTAGKFIWDVNNGDADPHSIADWYEGLTRGKVDHK